MLEVLTNSQKLAHRIARMIEKAFGGCAHFSWSDDWQSSGHRRASASEEINDEHTMSPSPFS